MRQMGLMGLMMVGALVGVGCASFDAQVREGMASVDVAEVAEIGRDTLAVYGSDLEQADRDDINLMIDGLVEFSDGTSSVEVLRARVGVGIAAINRHLNDGKAWPKDLKFGVLTAIRLARAFLVSYPDLHVALGDLAAAVREQPVSD